MILSLTAVGLIVLAIVLDEWRPEWLGAHPLTANMIAAVALLPAELLAVSIVFERVRDRAEKRRWEGVAAATHGAVKSQWDDLRALLRSRYSHDSYDDVTLVIRAG
jgi:hypothetical protein